MGIDGKYDVNKSWFTKETKMETSGSAGYNLFSAEEKTLKASSVTAISTHYIWKSRRDILVTFI